MRIGVDVGGTFTDLVVLSDGGIRLHKVSSTPADPSVAVLQGVDELGLELREVELFAHGTTVTTNAVIQRIGVPTGLLTTKGFRDVLQIRRTTRGTLYDFQWDPPPELVPRQWRREVAERVDAAGKVVQEPDVGAAVAEVEDLVRAGVRSLAICFINAYLNGANELAVREAIRERFPDLPIYVSSEILPAWREFERTSTTVVSAYIGPVLEEYLRRLESTLREQGYRYDLMVMLSNGGLATAETAIAAPAYTLGSGPAAGVLAQLALGSGAAAGVMAQLALSQATGITNIIGMDIGGTSTDVSLIYGGQPYLKGEFELEFGTTVSYPVIDINSIGAGGGTIAWVDGGGMLHSGPQSAGADPGPASMQRGGTEPTVTDANVLLHRLNPAYLLGGALELSEDAARQAVARVGDRLGLDPVEMAGGILTLTVSNIVYAIRQRTIERGLDPREFTLVAYGGAGPLHAAEVATELDIPRVLIPPYPGVTSATGLLLTDIRHDLVSTYLHTATPGGGRNVAERLAELAAQGRARLAGEGVPEERIRFAYAADLRYLGQTHELTVPLPDEYTEETHSQLSSLLREVHQKEFGHAPEGDEPIEIVNLRVAAIGELDRPRFPELAALGEPRPVGEREVYFADGWLTVPVYDRARLGQGTRVAGPAILEQFDSTTVIPPSWLGEVDAIGNLMLRRA